MSRLLLPVEFKKISQCLKLCSDIKNILILSYTLLQRQNYLKYSFYVALQLMFINNCINFDSPK